VNTGAPLPDTGAGTSLTTLAARAGNRPMCSWRAGCGGSRKSGSEGGGEETTGRKADTGASPPTLRERARQAVRQNCSSVKKQESPRAVLVLVHLGILGVTCLSLEMPASPADRGLLALGTPDRARPLGVKGRVRVLWRGMQARLPGRAAR
jgi:hypothetical protein